MDLYERTAKGLESLAERLAKECHDSDFHTPELQLARDDFDSILAAMASNKKLFRDFTEAVPLPSIASSDWKLLVLLAQQYAFWRKFQSSAESVNPKGLPSNKQRERAINIRESKAISAEFKCLDPSNLCKRINKHSEFPVVDALVMQGLLYLFGTNPGLYSEFQAAVNQQ